MYQKSLFKIKKEKIIKLPKEKIHSCGILCINTIIN